MAILNLIATLVLVALTGVYVLLTYFLVKESRRSIAQSQDFAEQSLQVQLLPQILVDVRRKIDAVHVEVINLSDSPAFELEIALLAEYSEDDKSASEFEVEYMTQKTDQRLGVSSEGFYGLYDFIRDATVPPKSSRTTSLRYPMVADTFTALVQYRDFHGRNYLQLYWFCEPTGGREQQSSVYSLESLDPTVPRVVNRIRVEGRKPIVGLEAVLDKAKISAFPEIWPGAAAANYYREYQPFPPRPAWHRV